MRYIINNIRFLLDLDITRIPDYVSHAIDELSNRNKDNYDDEDNKMTSEYVKLCQYIVKHDKDLITDLSNGLKKYIEEREHLYESAYKLSSLKDKVNFTTNLNIIYYLHKDSETTALFNTRMMAFLDTLKDLLKKEEIKEKSRKD